MVGQTVSEVVIEGLRELRDANASGETLSAKLVLWNSLLEDKSGQTVSERLADSITHSDP